MSQIDEAYLSDKQLVDLAFEYLEPYELDRLEQVVRQKVVGLRNVYKISGNWFTASHTDYSVKGHNPPCGQGKGELADEAAAGIAVLQLAAGAIDAAGGGGVATLISGIVSYFIGKNNTRQTTGVCIELCTLIPAEVDEDWIKKHVTIEYYLNDWEGQRKVSPGMFAWASLDPEIVVTHVDISHRYSEERDDETCRMTAIFARFKNWSHAHDRQIKMDLVIDDFEGFAHDCADYTIFNREQYDAEIAQSLDIETKQKLIDQYADALKKGARS